MTHNMPPEPPGPPNPPGASYPPGPSYPPGTGSPSPWAQQILGPGRPGPQPDVDPFPSQHPPRPPVAAAPRDDAGSRWQDAVGSPANYVAAALLVAVAAGYGLEVSGRFAQAGWLGALYVAVSAVAAVTSVVLTWRDLRPVWLTALLVSQLAVIEYVLTRSVDLPGAGEGPDRWGDPRGLVPALAALVVLVLAAWAVAQERPLTRWARSRTPLVAGLVALQVGAVATFAVASVKDTQIQLGTHGGLHGQTDTSVYWSAVSGSPFHPTGVTRTYYVAADEVVWDYAPLGRDAAMNSPFGETQDVFVTSGPGRIGSKYLKCLYRAYPDASFRKPAARPASEAYLGFWGPVIRAAVGDTVKVVFKNNCSIPASVHPHGVFYQKASEGAPYADNTTGKDTADDAVKKGGSHTYTWLVPDRAGPGPHDGSSVMWMYHSHVDEVADTYAGLMGPMIVTSAAMARPDATPKDVDQEVLQLYTVENENLSHYLKENLKRFAGRPYPEDLEDEGFNESNLMHSVNGYVYGNIPTVTIHKGKRVRWYVMSMGTEVDLHTPHWHANTVLVSGMRMDTVSLLPAGMVVADMVADNPGTWLFHCHVNDHLTAGMTGRYRVDP